MNPDTAVVTRTAPVPAPGQPEVGSPAATHRLVVLLERYALVILLAALIVFFSVLPATGGSFLTLNDGVFSLWNGHRPECSRPLRISRTRRLTTEDRLTRSRISSRNSGLRLTPDAAQPMDWRTRPLALEKSMRPA